MAVYYPSPRLPLACTARLFLVCLRGTVRHATPPGVLCVDALSCTSAASTQSTAPGLHERHHQAQVWDGLAGMYSHG